MIWKGPMKVSLNDDGYLIQTYNTCMFIHVNSQIGCNNYMESNRNNSVHHTFAKPREQLCTPKGGLEIWLGG